mmetsp:Transcript_2107/g.7865  ORF Transcript_2107/g.7865 Transcript_2107/m.7865 type:complete len:249 (+) Transcript_2107:1165-1911(+)
MKHLCDTSSSQANAKPGTRSGCNAKKALANAASTCGWEESNASFGACISLSKPARARKYGRALNATFRSSVSRIAVRTTATKARPKKASRDANASSLRRTNRVTRRTYASIAANESCDVACGVAPGTSLPRQCVTASSTKMRKKRSCVSSASNRDSTRRCMKATLAASVGGNSWTRAHSSKCAATFSRKPAGSGIACGGAPDIFAASLPTSCEPSGCDGTPSPAVPAGASGGSGGGAPGGGGGGIPPG